MEKPQPGQAEESEALFPRAVGSKPTIGRNARVHNLVLFSVGALALLAWQNFWSLMDQVYYAPPERSVVSSYKTQVESVARLPGM